MCLSARSVYSRTLKFNDRKKLDELEEDARILAHKMSISNCEQWYDVTVSGLVQHGGQSLLEYFDRCIGTAVSVLYPEIPWQPWRFRQIPDTFWTDNAQLRQYVEWLGRILGVKNLWGWYYVSKENFQQHDLLLSTRLGGSTVDIVGSICPELKKMELLDDVDSQRAYFDWLGSQLKFTEWEHWYQLTAKDVVQHRGSDLLLRYKVPSQALQAVYSHVSWQPWRFEQVLPEFWHEVANQKQYFSWLEEKLNIKEPQDWYKVTKAELFMWNANPLLSNYYDNTLYCALKVLVPSYEWLPWKFVHVGSLWEDVGNHVHYFEWLRRHLGIKEPREWLQIPKSQFVVHHGQQLLQTYYEDSPSKAIHYWYPEVEWQSREDIPRGFLDDLDYHKRYFEWLGQKLQIGKNWYEVTRQMIVDHGGGPILAIYEDCLHLALCSVYPDVQWQPWRFVELPEDYWHCVRTQRCYFDWLGNELGIVEKDGWYKVTKREVITNYGQSLLSEYYEDSLVDALNTVYGEKWQCWRFAEADQSKWYEFRHRDFFDWLYCKLEMKGMDEWHVYTVEKVHEYGGGYMMVNFYQNSLYYALMAVYPEHSWIPWKFAKVPSGYWNDISHHRQYFEWLGSVLAVRCETDWYTHGTVENVRKNYGSHLLSKWYQNSLHKALSAVYPEVQWQPWRFARVSTDFLHDRQQHAHFLTWMEQTLDLRRPEDWYGISRQLVNALHGRPTLGKYGGSLVHMLTEHYPSCTWDINQWRKSFGTKLQTYLLQCIRTLFPTVPIEYNARLPFLKYDRKSMQLDVWMPTLNVAIEYQGGQHYNNVDLLHGEQGFEMQCVKDVIKQEECEARCIRLFHVPVWWDCTVESLACTLKPCFQS